MNNLAPLHTIAHASLAEGQAVVKAHATPQGYVIVVERTKRVGNRKEGDVKVVYYQCSQSNAPVVHSGPGERIEAKSEQWLPFQSQLTQSRNQWLVRVSNVEHVHLTIFAHIWQQ
ncbi:hypothetical protein CCR75_001853 [Bremia lactucae]|uniref:Uncharacterized protein n=1 Tax=Bremia lactucae TaxID=4779 RepID=A0A976FGQ7_BRELC|nr:hypothetical protein CCR75_001853 [Bremia lactucae]